jgi:hypothetical protein
MKYLVRGMFLLASMSSVITNTAYFLDSIYTIPFFRKSSGNQGLS